MRFTTQPTNNPIQKYLNWEGHIDKGYWTFYDKENKEVVKYELTEFIILKLGYTIKGYNKKKGKGAYSNEVEKLSEPLTVKYFDQELIAEGLYREFKDKLPIGIRLHLAITVLHNGEMIEFFLKGKSFYDFNELLKVVNIQTNKIEFVGKIENKDGSIEYTEPEFDIGGAITENERNEAIEKDKSLLEFDKQKKEELEKKEQEEKEEQEKNDDFQKIDVPF